MTAPLLVALYGGPGVGKSTTAARLFAELKMRGHNAEYVPEVAKGFVWENRTVALTHQPYIAAKQMLHYDRLDGQVDIIVTDTSPLLSLIYGDTTLAFREWVVNDYFRRRTLNFMLRRSRHIGYNPAGRTQTEYEALQIDTRIEGMLLTNGIHHQSFSVGRDDLIERLVYSVEHVDRRY